MGRIKSTMVKKTAKNLFEKEATFNDSFDNNKKILGSSMPSKPIRNKIAGYLARLSRMKKAGPKVRKMPQPEATEVQADVY